MSNAPRSLPPSSPPPEELRSWAISTAFSKPSTSKPGAVLWKTRLGTSVQGFPVTFSIDGKQYIAVTTGLGGGSPRFVSRIVTPEIHVSDNGNALYVFELPDTK